MPISKENKKRYPPKKEWDRIRDDILGRAGYACECTGQCGISHTDGRHKISCAVPHRAKIVRSEDRSVWLFYRPGMVGKPVRIILTIAHHPDHAPENVDPGNLLAVCQLCHLRMDRWHHAANAAITRKKKKDAANGGKAGLELKEGE